MVVSLSLVGYSQDSITIKVADTNKITATHVYNDITARLDALSKALKVGANHVYGVVIKQQIVYSFTYLPILIAGIVLILIFFKRLKDKGEDWGNTNEGGGPTFLGLCRFLQGVAGVVLVIITLSNISEVVTGLINPEYGAMKDIVNWIK